MACLRRAHRGLRRAPSLVVAAGAALQMIAGCSLFVQEQRYSYDVYTEGLVQPPTANLTPGAPLQRGEFGAELGFSSAWVAPSDARGAADGAGNWWTNNELHARLAGGIGSVELGSAFAYGNGYLSSAGVDGLDSSTVDGRHSVSATPYVRVAPSISAEANLWFTLGMHVGGVTWTRRVVGSVESEVNGPFVGDVDLNEYTTDETFEGSRVSVRPHVALGAGGQVAHLLWVGGGASFETFERITGFQNVRGQCVSRIGQSCADDALDQAEYFTHQPAASVFVDGALRLENLSVVLGLFSTHPLVADDVGRLPLGARVSLIATGGRVRLPR